jgi:hypothetical protein
VNRGMLAVALPHDLCVLQASLLDFCCSRVKEMLMATARGEVSSSVEACLKAPVAGAARVRYLTVITRPSAPMRQLLGPTMALMDREPPSTCVTQPHDCDLSERCAASP